MFRLSPGAKIHCLFTSHDVLPFLSEYFPRVSYLSSVGVTLISIRLSIWGTLGEIDTFCLLRALHYLQTWPLFSSYLHSSLPNTIVIVMTLSAERSNFKCVYSGGTT